LVSRLSVQHGGRVHAAHPAALCLGAADMVAS
jgi:hypothetical protein